MKAMTIEEQKEALNLISWLAVDGCDFVASRSFSGGTCAEENGRGFNCSSCRAKIFLEKFGMTDD